MFNPLHGLALSRASRGSKQETLPSFFLLIDTPSIATTVLLESSGDHGLDCYLQIETLFLNDSMNSALLRQAALYISTDGYLSSDTQSKQKRCILFATQPQWSEHSIFTARSIH
ncbi:hypothetical protein FUT69_03910 [Xylella taiwanensis]|uniref:Uncharacterized protein n=1 Tax=Xylella taiwanensis TaxID=1444770 RepID=Z9JNT8_9GAMM|nr:hypothetical protein [Xylella taiwanensis]AXI84451.1 hypothetical protein AB672_11220 [Xylella taiwanensis]EWS79461.1 hypothetical protein AF72_00880 [Xylella taiwanensis]MCD8455347.1 hypothetical protein [Xylella taiwanensis]MCD8464052.1 hypothetical protein [Xylella taiwanensis]MCD8464392.1 hypothetical protein [Xylella taiwanensis]